MEKLYSYLPGCPTIWMYHMTGRTSDYGRKIACTTVIQPLVQHYFVINSVKWELKLTGFPFFVCRLVRRTKRGAGGSSLFMWLHLDEVAPCSQLQLLTLPSCLPTVFLWCIFLSSYSYCYMSNSPHQTLWMVSSSIVTSFVYFNTIFPWLYSTLFQCIDKYPFFLL